MNPDDENLISAGGLDEAVRDALRMEADAQQLARLEHYWRVLSRRERWRRRARWSVASAAAAAVLLAVVALVWNRGDEQQSLQAIQVAPPAPVEAAPNEPVVAENGGPAEPLPSAGREPTAYERLVFAARTNIHAPDQPPAVTIDALIEQVAASADADVGHLLEAANFQHATAERILMRRLPRATPDERRAILRLLAVCGSPRSTPALLQLARNEPLRDEALTTLEQVVGIERLAGVVGGGADPQVRGALIHRLLSADSPAALRGYLSLLHHEATRGDALAAARRAAELPLDDLLALLDDADEGVRVAAAKVLGHVNGPEIARRLIARVAERPANSAEAWLALMACRDEMANEFLRYASRRPQLLGHLNNARVRGTQMIP